MRLIAGTTVINAFSASEFPNRLTTVCPIGRAAYRAAYINR
jgi:hypothetical protein